MNYIVPNIYGRIKNPNQEVSVPCSKSMTVRAMLLAALADGESTLNNVELYGDCQTFLNCLTAIGINSKVSENSIKIQGCNKRLPQNKCEINVGSAGTAARFFPALFAFSKGEYHLTCSDQMKKRPIAPLINSLKSIGVKFKFDEQENSYPFTMYGAEKIEDVIQVDISLSSQFLSALLISAVCANKNVKIKLVGNHGLEYVKMTIAMMSHFGVNVVEHNGIYEVGGTYTPQNYEVEPDMSAACYFYAMNKILNTNIRVKGVKENSLQGDTKFIHLLQTFNGGEVDMSEFSDQALTLAAISPFLDTPTQIYGIAHIRGQECDRIKAIVENLTSIGVKCEEYPDGVKIYPTQPSGGIIQTYGDHRVAMSFALTGLRADNIQISNPTVCSKTFPTYFTTLTTLIQSLT